MLNLDRSYCLLSISCIAVVSLLAFPVIGNGEVSNPTRVWAEYGVATIHVGSDVTHNADVFRKVLIGAIGPESVPLTAHDKVRGCTLQSLVRTGEGLPPLLDQGAASFIDIEAELRQARQTINTANIKQLHLARIQEVSKIFSRAVEVFHERLSTCLGDQKALHTKFHIGVVVRVCQPFGTHSCDGPAFTKLSRNLSYTRFQKVYEWIRSVGYADINIWHQLAPDGVVKDEIASPVELFPLSTMWPPMPADSVALKQFEFAATKHRTAGTTFDYPVARLVRLTRTPALHLLDVLNSPSRAVADLTLRREPLPQLTYRAVPHGGVVVAVIAAKATVDPLPELELVTVSDEVARTRIAECVRFRAMRDAANISKCSGYKLTDRLLIQCLDGKRCVPDFADQAMTAVFAVGLLKSGRELISSSAVARIVPTGTIADFHATARECHRRHPANAAAATLCGVEQRAKPREAQTLNCLQHAKQLESSTQCLTDALGGEATKKLAACIADVKRDPTGAVLCASANSLNEDSRRIVQCMQEYKRTSNATDAALCVGQQHLSSDQQLAAKCVQQHPKNWSSAAVCVVEKKSPLPPVAKDAVSCAQTHGSDPKMFAGCMAAKNLPELSGDLGRFAKCSVMNQGAALATAACMMADQLTPEQQIALQCASNSPELLTFATCTGGQLTIREFIKCQDQKIGQGECFGTNNEIRKFFKNVFNQDINDATVVGQIMNAHLEVAKAQIAFAEAAGKTLGQLADGATQLGQQISEGVTHATNEITKEAEKARESACNTVACIGGKVPILLPVPLPKVEPYRLPNGTCIPLC